MDGDLLKIFDLFDQFDKFIVNIENFPDILKYFGAASQFTSGIF